MALPSSSLSACSIRGNLGLDPVLAPPPSISSAKPLSTGFSLMRSGEFSKDFSGGSNVPPGDLYVRSAKLSGSDRNSIHFQAASGLSPPLSRMSESPAMVVLQPAGPL